MNLTHKPYMASFMVCLFGVFALVADYSGGLITFMLGLSLGFGLSWLLEGEAK